MSHPKLRRVLAASVLMVAVSLSPVSGAQGAVRAKAQRDHGASRIQPHVTWLRVLRAALDKAGIRIDPNGVVKDDGGH